jgi:hypothetical protein
MEGIEPSPTVYHTVVLTLTPHQRYLVVLGGNDPPSLPYQGTALPLSYRTMEVRVGVEPTCFRNLGFAIPSLTVRASDLFVHQDGIEPPTPGSSIPCSTPELSRDIGVPGGGRTHDLRIKSPLFYH